MNYFFYYFDRIKNSLMILFEDRNGENSQIDADKRNYNEQLVSP